MENTVCMCEETDYLAVLSLGITTPPSAGDGAGSGFILTGNLACHVQNHAGL